jgi:hypothetical protein
LLLRLKSVLHKIRYVRKDLQEETLKGIWADSPFARAVPTGNIYLLLQMLNRPSWIEGKVYDEPDETSMFHLLQ